MAERMLGQAPVFQCPDGHGVFLDRADLGALVEAESDWHRNASQHTAPLPRITPDMTAPPAAAKRSRAWVESLFG
jgi:Zn-finger nucleic acid-binding protein